MLNINELETKWRKYKVKSYIPYVIILVSTIIITIAIYSLMNTTSINSVVVANIEKENITLDIKKDVQIAIKESTKKESTQNDVKIIEKIIVKKDIDQSHQSDKKNIILTPSLGFMSNMKHNNIYNEDEITSNFPTKDTIKKVKTEKPKVIVKEIIEEPEEVTVEEVKTVTASSIKIDRRNSQEDIEYVIKRFKKNNKPALSLFIAKKYYSLNEYHKAYNYALITNELNDNIDASWIIFAKSLVKLNEKGEAIKTLKKYIEHSHSSQAKILLDDIVSGDFK